MSSIVWFTVIHAQECIGAYIHAMNLRHAPYETAPDHSLMSCGYHWNVKSSYSEIPVNATLKRPFRVGDRHDDVIEWKYFSALLARCAGNSPVTGEFPSQRPVTRNFDVFFHQRLNKRLSEHSQSWWFETPSCSLWRHCNGMPREKVSYTFDPSDNEHAVPEYTSSTTNPTMLQSNIPQCTISFCNRNVDISEKMVHCGIFV